MEFCPIGGHFFTRGIQSSVHTNDPPCVPLWLRGTLQMDECEKKNTSSPSLFFFFFFFFFSSKIENVIIQQANRWYKSRLLHHLIPPPPPLLLLLPHICPMLASANLVWAGPVVVDPRILIPPPPPPFLPPPRFLSFRNVQQE